MYTARTPRNENRDSLPSKAEVIAGLIGIIISLGILYSATNYEQDNPIEVVKNDYTYISDNGCKYTKQCIFGKVYISGCTGTAIFLDDIGRPISCKKGEFK